MIKISEVAAVNPKHVIAVLFDKKSLQTVVVMPGMATIPSDHTFQETINLLSTVRFN